MKQCTHKEFLTTLETKNVHYAAGKIQILSEYEGYSKPITSRCVKCGYVWTVTAGSLLAGRGCAKCAGHIRLTIEELQNRVSNKHSGITISGEIQNQRSRVKCSCSVCGYRWETSAASLAAGHGCPKCSGSKKKTTEDFRLELEKLQPNIELQDEYVNDKTPITFHCKKCGYIWKTTPGSIHSGTGCPKCAGRPSKTTESFRDELAHKKPDIELIGEYVSTHVKAQFKCKVCGRKWEAEPNSVLGGSGCPDCGQRRTADARRKDHSDFIVQLTEVNPDIEVLGEYRSIHDKVQFKCRHCGNVWEAEPNSVLRGTGCPECWHGNTSFPEQFIRFALEDALGSDNVASRDRKTCGFEIDIYLPRYKYGIEYGAWFWHKDRVESDQEKISKAAASGVQLLVIYDSFQEKTVPFEGCIVFEKPAGEQNGYIFLKNIVEHVLNDIGKVDCYSMIDWRKASRCAKQRANRMSENEFTAIIAKTLPNLEVRGSFHGYKEQVLMRCKVCGNKWSASAANFLMGHGCPVCAGNTKPTQDEFVQAVKKANPNVEIIGEYINSKTNVLTRCKVCGNEWMATPSSLKHGSGCKKCSDKKLAKERTFSQEEFETRVAKKNPNVRVLGKYTGNKNKALVRCLIHNIEWEALPSGLMYRGSGCKLCKSEKIKAAQRKSQEQFISEMHSSNPNIEILGKYVNSGTKVLCRCKTCGNEWHASPSPLLKGHGCPECGKNKCHQTQRKSPEQFIAEMHKKHPEIEVLGTYINSTTKIRFKCNKCSNEWTAVPQSLLGGSGCPKCGREKMRKSQSIGLNELQKRVAEKHPCVHISGEYKNQKSRIKCQCDKCGHVWETSAASLMLNHGCPKCAGMAKRTHEQFIEEMLQKHPNIEVLGTYKNTKTKIDLHCKECDNTWSATPNSLLNNGSGCPVCGRARKKIDNAQMTLGF